MAYTLHTARGMRLHELPTSLLFIVAAASWALVGCSSERQRAGDAAVSSGSSPAPGAADPKAAVASAVLLLDVRTADEFAAGHLPKAENIPVDRIEASIDQIKSKVSGDLAAPIVVYCASGGRAGRAKTALEKAGFTHVTNAGGYADLKD